MTHAPHRTEPHRLRWQFVICAISATIYFTGSTNPWWLNALIGAACFIAAAALDETHRFAKRKIAASRDADGSTGI